jgi:hypothetical protein
MAQYFIVKLRKTIFAVCCKLKLQPMNIKTRKLAFYLFISFTLMTLQGCYAPQFTSAEVLFPAKETNLAENLETATLVNRSYLPSSQREKSGVYYKGDSYAKTDTYVDSVVSDNALFAFAYNLNIAPKGQTVKNDSIYKMPVQENEFLQPLSMKEVNRICEEMNADVIISLEAFHSFDSLYRYLTDAYYVSERKTSLLTAWRVYKYGHHRPVYQSYIEDSIYFNAYGYSRYSADKDLISYKNALYEISYSSGEKFFREISPHWKEIERIYFDYYSRDMAKGNEFADKKLWKKAAAVWRPVAEKQKGSKSAYAAYNMAIASEMTGNLELAMFWLNKALEMRSDNYYFLEYRKTLRERISRQQVVDRQLGAD